ncbi:TPA: XyeA family putative rSAM-modified RiPP [Aeromonas hydrophila]|uniref:XyeA family cyclophane-containing RiPP triceptide n=1 Tax=Aeromonas hydrophila TaxID=644 RepID=UPI0028D9FDAC|nr:XyeA family putative rSAM-modified RiPP [Aeromonas hydrophila]
MSNLQHEIASNNAQVNDADDNVQRKELVDNLLDTVSGGGGWLNISWSRALD